MRAVVQRVVSAEVAVIEEGGERISGAIGAGMLVLVGVTVTDTDIDAAYIADKVAGMRIFEDADGKINLSCADIGGSVLLVSNFTLYGDCRKGRRPSFTAAAPGETAESLYNAVGAKLEAAGITTQYGKFGAHMRVSLVNDGPVTLLLDSSRAL